MKLIKSLLMGAVAIFTAAALPSCKNKVDDRLEMTADDGEKMIEYAYISYDDMISFIVEGYQCHWSFDTTPSVYSLSDVYCNESPTMGFIKTDLDGDGVVELIFGDNPDTNKDGVATPSPTIIYDIMTIDTANWERSSLASGGERDRIYLSDKGYIVKNGKTYRIKNGKLVRKFWKVNPDNYLRLDLEPFIKYAAPAHLCGGWSEERGPLEEDLAVLGAYFRQIGAGGVGCAAKVVKVSTQVVAGLNYRFIFEDGSKLELYKDLQGNVSKLK